jgi:hypothetical protein
MNTQASQPETVTKPTLGVSDLITVAQIIQIATSRGVWKPEELSTVGNIYDRLMAFLDAAGAVTKPTDTTAESELPTADTKEN